MLRKSLDINIDCLNMMSESLFLLECCTARESQRLYLYLKTPKNSPQTNEGGLSHSCQHPNNVSLEGELGSRTLCFIATLLCYSFIPDNFTNYAQLYSPLCPMCTQLLRDSSDRVGALSRSSNDMWTPSP